MPIVPDPEVEADYSFVVTIPQFGKPDRIARDLLRDLERHVKLSLSSHATVSPLQDWYDDVRQFHEVFDAPIADKPTYIPEDLMNARWEFLVEEMDELDVAMEAEDIVGVADALADIIYFCIGTALCYGIPLRDVWDEVQRSNMAKVGPDGVVHRDPRTKKVLKPEGWTPPDIESIIQKARESK